MVVKVVVSSLLVFMSINLVFYFGLSEAVTVI